MNDPTDALPLALRTEVRRILETRVVGGSARFQESGDRSGVAAQKEISTLLIEAGIRRGSPLWTAVRDYGRQLYYGTSSGQVARAQRAAPATPATGRATSFDEGKVFTEGSSFRARAEAQQRRYRADVLRTGWQEYGHWLDQAGIERRLNFVHPAAADAAEARAAAGKGVDRERTFGNMLSSQALCFNIFGPLATCPAGLKLAGELLSAFIPGLRRIDAIHLEYTPPFELFRDQSGLAGVDCDVLIEFQGQNGAAGVLVIEVKFVEPTFSTCGHRRKEKEDVCPVDVRVGQDFSVCRYVTKNRFLYWDRCAQTKSLRLPLSAERGCPFGGPLWQLWVNHTLAHAHAASRGATRAMFAVCAPEQNEPLLQRGRVLEDFRQLVTDPASVVFLPLEGLLTRLSALVAERAEWRDWAARLHDRYLISLPDEPKSAACGKTALTDGHRAAVGWMGTAAFREIVRVHRAVCGQQLTIYFRPTDKGIVRIALHPAAPGYVGFRNRADGDTHVLQTGCAVPTADALRAHLCAFERWLPTVTRRSHEEQGVMPWLRHALDQDLMLPDLGAGWAFLHQEWRWIADDGKGKKSDVLAVHLPTGRLGIVEFKAVEKDLPEARKQVNEYAGYWNRDAESLAGFFTALLRAMGTAYDNESVSRAQVQAAPAKLFIGTASPRKGVRLREC